LHNTKQVPSNLFSHSDQMVQIQMGGVPREDATGWGGRLLDCVSAGNKSLGGISTASSAPFIASLNRRQAIVGLLSFDGGSLLRAAANKAFAEGMQLGTDLAAASTSTPLATTFPQTTLGKQLKLIASLMQLRAGQGPGRQVFIATLGGFDTHSGQDWQQWDLFLELDAALDAFHTCVENDLHLGSQVTSFSLADFGRTLQSNGLGSDHAWGNHQFVIGGAVHGGLYGQMPNFQLSGPDDANTRGVWIPQQSTEQFAFTLGRWFGASDDELAWAFPSVEKFTAQDLGFMG